MKKIVKIIPFLSSLLFCLACGANGPEPGPIDCKALCFTSVGSGLTLGWTSNNSKLVERLEKTIEVSQDGRTWHIWDGSPETTHFFPLSPGEKFYIRNTSDKLSESESSFFYFTSSTKVFGQCEISGDISSLINYSDKIEPYTFYSLFYDKGTNHGLDIFDASQLVLPYNELSEGCYQNMFMSCIYLKSTPQLPATQLAKSCYERMFANCHDYLNIYTSETSTRTKFFTAPVPLPDTCSEMFFNCGGEASSSEFKVEAGQSYYYENQI